MIGHDMGLMAQFASRIGIMYGGKIIEIGPVANIFQNPRHPYTRLLISSLPDTRSKRSTRRHPRPTTISLASPRPVASSTPDAPTRWTSVTQDIPITRELDPNRYVACHLYGDSDGKEVVL